MNLDKKGKIIKCLFIKLGHFPYNLGNNGVGNHSSSFVRQLLIFLAANMFRQLQHLFRLAISDEVTL